MLWEEFKNAIPIEGLDLQIGVFIWIDRSWKEHPFLTNKFLIKTEAELLQLKGIGIENVYWIPAKSKQEPLKAQKSAVVANKPQVVEDEASIALKALIAQKNEQMAQQRKLIAKADREWKKSAAMVRESMLSLRDNPKQNGIKLKNLAKSIASTIISNDALLILLREKSNQGLYHHVLNCMSLSVLLAKFLKLPEPVISEIALGAIAHDVGQTMIAKHILDSDSRNKIEESVFRTHCQQGADIAKSSGEFSSIAMSIIAEHHENFDGTGYPAGKKGNEISLATRIFSIVNRYESLCGTTTKGGDFLTPAEVLRLMWKTEKNHFDSAIFPAFIKLLGVYPPGSIVSLNDGSVGLVISPGDSSLHPKVLVYDPNVTKDEAEIVDLIADDGLQIESSINPKELSSEIAQWMNVGTSFTLYFATPQ